MKIIATIVFIIGLVVSGFLTAMFLSAIYFMGWQPAPLYLDVARWALLLLPLFGLAAKMLRPTSVSVTLAAGTMMIIVPLVYYGVLVALDS